MSGYLYLVQPDFFIGTNIYKLGRTTNLKKRLLSYGIKNKLIHSCLIKERLIDKERILHQLTKSQFGSPKYRLEYYEINDINKAISIINEIANFI